MQASTVCSCGEECWTNAKFCGHCGEFRPGQIAASEVLPIITKKACFDCGEELKSESKFCSHCGKIVRQLLKVQECGCVIQPSNSR
jgi:hypothetical protein